MPSPSTAEGDLAEALVGSADSPEKHRALAGHFDARAGAARRDANVHHEMEFSYIHFGFPGRAMVDHCRKLIPLDKRIAAEFSPAQRGHIAESVKPRAVRSWPCNGCETMIVSRVEENPQKLALGPRRTDHAPCVRGVRDRGRADATLPQAMYCDLSPSSLTPKSTSVERSKAYGS